MYKYINSRKLCIILVHTLLNASFIIIMIVGNPNRKNMHIFGSVGIFEYICKTTFNIIFIMCTKPQGKMPSLNLHMKARN